VIPRFLPSNHPRFLPLQWHPCSAQSTHKQILRLANYPASPALTLHPNVPPTLHVPILHTLSGFLISEVTTQRTLAFVVPVDTPDGPPTTLHSPFSFLVSLSLFVSLARSVRRGRGWLYATANHCLAASYR
jgi:hypothetical protein